MGRERVKIVSPKHGVVRANLYTSSQPYTFGGFMIVSMKSFEVVRDARLSGRDREVLDYLLLHVEFGNVSVDLSTQEMALVLGTSAPVVSRSLLKLESSGLIDRGQRGVVHMNPELWFKGGAKEQAAAVFKWHQRMRRAQRKRSKAAA